MSDLIPPPLSYPGVYVVEAPSGAHSISGLPTTVAFVGSAVRGRPLTPTVVRDWAAYDRTFGPTAPAAGTHLDSAVRAFFDNDGTRLVVVRSVDPAAASATASLATDLVLVANTPGEWANRVHVDLSIDPVDPTAVVRSVVEEDDGAEHVVEQWTGLRLTAGDPRHLATVLRRDSHVVHARDNADGSAFAGTPASLGLTPGATRRWTMSGGTDGDPALAQHADALTAAAVSLRKYADVSVLAAPGVVDPADLAGVLAEVNRRGDVFLVIDAPDTADLQALQQARDSLGEQPSASLHAPWVWVTDPAGLTHAVPPSGFIAGILARTDAQRGVWQAPAGLGAFLLGATSLTHTFTDAEQGPLNNAGISVIRSFPDAGIVSWGARTLGTNPDEPNYIQVRRMQLYIHASVVQGTQWAAFEANDEALWAALTQSVSAFLDTMFQEGAFAGATAAQSYQVMCDATTNPPASVAAGVMTLFIRFAPVRPAEFVQVVVEQRVASAP